MGWARRCLRRVPRRTLDITTAGDCVVAHIRQSGRFAGGGSRVAGAVFHALWFRYSKVSAMRHYTTRAEALDAVGLSK